MSMNECKLRGIDTKSLHSRSSYLFGCLESAGGDPVTVAVRAASSISISTGLETITRLFCDLSVALKDVNVTTAAQLLRPLQDKAIFPVLHPSRGRSGDKYDSLAVLNDSSWFIADQPRIRESFLSKLPLLALLVRDVSRLQDLLRVLRLEDRMLSKLALSRTQSKGQVERNWGYTATLLKRVPFIQAYVPVFDG